MAIAPQHLRRGVIVVLRLPNDKARPAVVVRSDLLENLPYATVLPFTTERRTGIDFRIPVQPTEGNGLREPSDVMVDWPQTVRVAAMGEKIGQLDPALMRRITEQLALVLGIG